MTGISKPLPWNWSWNRCLAARLGLPRPDFLPALWEGSGGKSRELIRGDQLSILPTSGPFPWVNHGFELYSSVSHRITGKPSNVVFPVTTRAGTMFAYVRPRVIQESRILTVANSGNSRFAILYGRTGSTFSAFFRNAALGLIQINTPTPIEVHRWYSVAATAEEGDGRLYLNGRLEAVSTAVDAANTLGASGTDAINIGALGASVLDGGVSVAIAWRQKLPAPVIQLISALPYLYHCRATHAALLALQQNAAFAAYFRTLQQHLGA